MLSSSVIQQSKKQQVDLKLNKFVWEIVLLDVFIQSLSGRDILGKHKLFGLE